MPLFEIEDQYIDQLRAAGLPVRDATAEFRRAKDHETFINGVSQNPQHRQKLLELISATGTYVPEIEAAKPVISQVEALASKFDKYVADEAERRQKESEDRENRSTQNLIEGGRRFLRAEGWDDDGIAEVENFMKTNSVGSYEVASKYLKGQKPAPDPLPNAAWNGNDLGSSWFHPPEDAPDHKLLLQDPQAFTSQEIRKFFREKAEGKLKY